jgi:SAM-dependent methyltransferase
VIEPTTRFPTGFFGRIDETDDGAFYVPDRLVMHIDDHAIRAVGELYLELSIGSGPRSPVLDLMSSWTSHFLERPDSLTVLGMNERELAANPMADARIVHDLNRMPIVALRDQSFGAAVCCVSVDYLTRPFEVFAEVARVLKPDAPFVCTFSNRCFPTKVIRGWMSLDDDGRCALVAEYFRSTECDGSPAFTKPTVRRCTPVGHRGDPLFAVYAQRTAPLGGPLGGFPSGSVVATQENEPGNGHDDTFGDKRVDSDLF